MNMSKVLPVSLTVLSLSAVCGTAMAEGYPKELEKDLISVCRNAAEDDRSGLRQAGCVAVRNEIALRFAAEKGG